MVCLINTAAISDQMIAKSREAVTLIKRRDEGDMWHRHLNKIILYVQMCYNNNGVFIYRVIYLTKGKRIFTNRIKVALNQSMLKLNVILSADFILPTTARSEIKTYNIGNSAIDENTASDQLYCENVQQ